MRRLRFSWVLPLLLVFAQHGAVLHELTHLQHSEPSKGVIYQGAVDLLDNGPCLACQAFSQVVSPAASKAIALAVSPATFNPSADPCYAIVTADTLTPRSRGPPQV